LSSVSTFLLDLSVMAFAFFSFAVDSTPPSLRTYARPKPIVATYFTLQLVAFLSLFVLLFTFLSNRAKRDGTISNLILIFMAVSIGMSIL